MVKNVLITGANGQLGREMQKLLLKDSNFNSYFTDVEELDITNQKSIYDYASDKDINYIINCAAYTAVDLAEDNQELCDKINHIAVENIGKVAKIIGARVIHISTDYVFDGKSNQPYNEDDATAPQSVYGTTKLNGENALKEIIPDDFIIIRTAWLYSSHGKNFVKTMLNLGYTKSNINVVADQIGTPTYAGDLANVIYKIISNDKWIPGIYHYSNEGVCSWYDFTKMIHEIAGITECVVNPITTEEYPTKASRPSYSVLSKRKIKDTFNLNIPHWVDSLEKCIKELTETK